MATTAEETLADEQRRRPRAAAAAFAGGTLTLLGGILATVVYRDRPDVFVLDALRERLSGGAVPEPGLKARQVLFYDDHALEILGVSLVLTLGVAAIGFALVELYRSVKVRRPEFPRTGLVAAVAGAVMVAVATLVHDASVVIGASSFAGSADQTPENAHDVLQSPFVIAALILRQAGVFALGAAFILISLNAMRVGLLTRFMGVLGIIVGVLFVVPLGSSLPIVQAFWLIALGVLLSGRWPGGEPPAWQTGEAIPWPTQQEIRERREERLAQERGDEPDAVDEDDDEELAEEIGLDEDDDAAPERAPHPSSKKRKRKRRA